MYRYVLLFENEVDYDKFIRKFVINGRFHYGLLSYGAPIENRRDTLSTNKLVAVRKYKEVEFTHVSTGIEYRILALHKQLDYAPMELNIWDGLSINADCIVANEYSEGKCNALTL